MILEKDNVKRILTDEQTIKIFENSGWTEVKEQKASQEPTVKELKEKLTEMGIEFDSKAKREDLIALLEKNENEGAGEENSETSEE